MEHRHAGRQEAREQKQEERLKAARARRVKISDGAPYQTAGMSLQG